MSHLANNSEDGEACENDVAYCQDDGSGPAGW